MWSWTYCVKSWLCCDALKLIAVVKVSCKASVAWSYWLAMLSRLMMVCESCAFSICRAVFVFRKM